MHQQTEIINRANIQQKCCSAATINPPLYRASTVLFNNYEEFCKINRQKEYQGITYGTDRLPTQRQFEDTMQRLEGAALTRILPSGIAAIQCALMFVLKAGDHLLICDNAYASGQHFCTTVLKKFGIETTEIPPNSGKNIEQYIRPETRAILLESPGSITLEIQDIPAITEIARSKGIITLIDNTWATPLFLKPFSLGVDIIVQSLTKYVCGYSDVLAGSVSVSEKYSASFAKFYKTIQAVTSSEECYLSLRGLNTLVTRLNQHQQSGLTIAHWLNNHPLVENVLHPALESHPEHHLWQRDFQGASGLFSFTFKQNYSERQLADFIDTLQLFSLGYSWGGYKSLLLAYDIKRQTPFRYDGKKIIRLNIGLENSEDLLADLETGLKKLLPK